MDSKTFQVPQPPAKHTLHSAYFHPILKKWSEEAPLTANNICYPIFVSDNEDAKEEIKALPGQYRWGVNRLPELLDPLVKKGLTSIIIFGVLSASSSSKKDEVGTFATDAKSPVAAALKLCTARYPSLLLACDVCLCAYTSHGHCGICKSDGSIDNPASIQRIAEVAVFYAQNGAHVVAPSDMMDGRIGAIKAGLRKLKLDSVVSVMSYSAKFASVFYGPFREAAASGMSFGDRSKYQLPPVSRDLALRAMARDVEEGADSIMVKPGGPYLDLVRDAKNLVHVPIAVYHVSGEYAMLWHGAKHGAFNLDAAVMEAMTSFRRAGATIILTYFADLILDNLAAQQKQQLSQPIRASL